MGIAGERTSGEFRSEKMQRAFEWTQGYGRSLPRRVGVLSVSWSRFSGHWREQRGIELLFLGRSAQYLRPRGGRADVHGKFAERLGCVKRRQNDSSTSAISFRLLCQGLRRPN